MILKNTMNFARLVSCLGIALASGCGAAEAPTPASNSNAATPGAGGGAALPGDPALGPDPGTPGIQTPVIDPSTGQAIPPASPGASATPTPVANEPVDIIIDSPDATFEMRAGIYPGDPVDLLFVVDNSTSMGDKQALFVEAIPDLIDMLVNPPCLDIGVKTDPLDDTIVPFEADGGCPSGVLPAFAAITDMHMAVISSSLGSHGLGADADICSDVPEQNDAAHLIGLKRTGSPEVLAESYGQLGFLAWNPDPATANGADTVQAELVRKFQAQVASVGESGCGFEAPLEAAYRFLVEPVPYETLQRVPCSEGAAENNCVSPSGVDAALLAQRQAFLRPDSHVVVTYLTDENDCSVKDSGQGYYTLRPTDPMPRGTAACADPNDTCCQSCATMIRAGCDADPTTNGCDPLFDPLEDSASKLVEAYNVRCFNQKRRFGIDLLYPTNRYLAGFKNPTIVGSDGVEVPNPIFAGGRQANQIFVVGIVGTPWQDVTVDPADPSGKVQRAASLPWEWFLPSETSAVPLDPFNVEAMEIRPGTNPVTGDVLGGPETTNAINGHDRVIASGDGLTDDLQYACTFQLPTPRDCSSPETSADSCDCTQNPSAADPAVIEDYATGNPLCLAPDGTYGTTQYRAKAYPSPRVMEVVRGMEDQGVLGSICPRNADDPSRQDYGYRPPIRALLLGLASSTAR